VAESGPGPRRPSECAGRISIICRGDGALFLLSPAPPFFIPPVVEMHSLTLLQLAGNYANLPTRDLNLAAAEYIGARIVYTAIYMSVKSEAVSYLRTGVYAWGLGVPLWVLWKAGVKVRDEMLNGEGEGKTL